MDTYFFLSKIASVFTEKYVALFENDVRYFESNYSREPRLAWRTQCAYPILSWPVSAI